MSVAQRAITRLQDADDLNVTLGAGVDGYALTYDNATGKFVTVSAIRAAAIKPLTDSTTALQMQNAAGTPILNVDTTNRRVGLHTTAPATPVDITRTETGIAAARPVLFNLTSYALPSGPVGQVIDYHGLDVTGYTNSANVDGTTRLYPFESKAQSAVAAPGVLGQLVGVYGLADNAGTGTVSEVRAIRVLARATGAGAVTTLIGVGIDAPTINGGAVTTAYGLQIGNVSVATTNYALYTGTGLNRLGDQLAVVGSADRIQLVCKAHATQTTSLQQWQSSSGTVLASFSGDGRLGIGATPAAYAHLTVSPYIGDTANTENYAALINPSFAPANDVAKLFYGSMNIVNLYDSSATGNITGYLYGGSFRVNVRTATRATTRAVGGDFRVYSVGSGGNFGDITTAIGAEAMVQADGGTIATAYLFHATNPTGAGAVTNAYGLYVDAITKGGTGNYALYTNAGRNWLGDATTIVQVNATGAVPVLTLQQTDDSEDMIEFIGTVGVGNAIEAVGAKTLTTTNFIKVTIAGVGERYIPVGTIA